MNKVDLSVLCTVMDLSETGQEGTSKEDLVR